MRVSAPRQDAVGQVCEIPPGYPPTRFMGAPTGMTAGRKHGLAKRDGLVVIIKYAAQAP